MQYQIIGEPFSVVVFNLTEGENVFCQSGSMAWMSANMEMETTSRGGIGGFFKRMITGENAFMNKFTAKNGSGLIAFATHFPGTILPVEIGAEHELIVQRTGYLASEEGVDSSVFFQKKFAAGLFGEGFILQKLTGHGMAFVEIDGYLQEYDLKPGQQIILNTGYLAAMESSCSVDVVSIKGIKNVLFGGEGFFNTVVTGPGKVYVQTQPISVLANALKPYLPSPTTSVSTTGSSDK